MYTRSILGHHISDHDAINSTAILFLSYKEVISPIYRIVGAVTWIVL